MSNFAKMLKNIASGKYVHGTYLRKAVDCNGTISFASLTVATDGGTVYETTDPAENEAFFRLVDYRSNGVGNYCRSAKDHRYESMGFWQKS